MKRILICMLAMMLAIGGLSAAAEERGGVDLSYERAAQMGVYMREIVMGDYLDIKQTSESYKTIAKGWAEGVTETPRLVVQLDVENQAYIVETSAIFSQEPDVVELEAVSTNVSMIWHSLAQYAAEESGVTAASYEEIIQVNGAISATTMYADEGREGNGMYIMLYENAAPVLLIVSAENGAVSMRGLFLPSPKLAKCQNYGQVSLYLMLNGFGMSCQEIKPE